MDFILRHLNARGFVLWGGGLALLFLAATRYDAPYRWYQDKHFAQERGPAVFAPDIAQDLEKRNSQRLLGLYRDVSAEIAAAKARGHDVRNFQSVADRALALNTPAGRAYATDTLNKLRVIIPQPLDALRAATGADVPRDNIPTPPSKPAAGKRSR
jgi:hypothetical protein